MQALNQITGAIEDIEKIMNEHLKDYTKVFRHYTPYDPKEWTDLLKQVHRDFGRPAERWCWQLHRDFGRPSERWAWMIDHQWQKQMMEDPERRGVAVNEWHVIFYFKEEYDAVMFGLKY